MKMKIGTIKSIPEWATTYIMYCDESGLTEPDKREIDHFLYGLLRYGCRLIEPIEGTHNEFCPYPAFGLACATQDWIAEYVAINKKGE